MPTEYKVEDQTSLERLTLTQFLAHEKTKSSLTVYLRKNIIERFSGTLKFLVSADGEAYGYLPHAFVSDHEEADSLMIHHIMQAEQILIR